MVKAAVVTNMEATKCRLVAELDVDTMKWSAKQPSDILQEELVEELDYNKFIEMLERLNQTTGEGTFSEASNQSETIQHFLIAPCKLPVVRNTRKPAKKKRRRIDKNKDKIIQKIFNRTVCTENYRYEISADPVKEIESKIIGSDPASEDVSSSGLHVSAINSSDDHQISPFSLSNQTKQNKRNDVAKGKLSVQDKHCNTVKNKNYVRENETNLPKSPNTPFTNSDDQETNMSPGSKSLQKKYVQVCLQRLGSDTIKRFTSSDPKNTIFSAHSEESLIVNENRDFSSPSQEEPYDLQSLHQCSSELLVVPLVDDEIEENELEHENREQLNQSPTKSASVCISNQNNSGVRDMVDEVISVPLNEHVDSSPAKVYATETERPSHSERQLLGNSSPHKEKKNSPEVQKKRKVILGEQEKVISPIKSNQGPEYNHAIFKKHTLNTEFKIPKLTYQNASTSEDKYIPDTNENSILTIQEGKKKENEINTSLNSEKRKKFVIRSRKRVSDHKTKDDRKKQTVNNQTSMLTNLNDDENITSSTFVDKNFLDASTSEEENAGVLSPHKMSCAKENKFENFSVNLQILKDSSSSNEKHIRQVVTPKSTDPLLDTKIQETTYVETRGEDCEILLDNSYEDTLDYEPDAMGDDKTSIDNMIKCGKIEAVVQNDDTVFLKITSPEAKPFKNYTRSLLPSQFEMENEPLPETNENVVEPEFNENVVEPEEYHDNLGYASEEGEIVEESHLDEGLLVFPESQELDDFLTSDSNDTETHFQRTKKSKDVNGSTVETKADCPNTISVNVDGFKTKSDVPNKDACKPAQLVDDKGESCPSFLASGYCKVRGCPMIHDGSADHSQRTKSLIEVLQQDLSEGLLNRAVDNFVTCISGLKRNDAFQCILAITQAIFKFSLYKQLKDVVHAVLNRKKLREDEDALNYIVKLSEPNAGLVKDALMPIFYCAQSCKYLRLSSDTMLILLKSLCDQPNINLKEVINILFFHVVVMKYSPPMEYVNMALQRVKEHKHLAVSVQNLLKHFCAQDLAKLDIELYEAVHEILLSYNKIHEAKSLEDKLDELRLYKVLQAKQSEESFTLKVQSWINNGKWKEIVQYFIQGAVKQEDVIVIHNVHCALLANTSTLVSNLRMFISFVKEHAYLGIQHIMVVGQMVTAMMLEMNTAKNYILSYELLSLLHAFNINYYHLQLSVIRNSAFNPKFLMTSWALTTPNIVALVALDTCLEVNMPLAAFNILNSCNWARPLKEITATICAQESILRGDILFKLAKSLLVDSNLEQGAQTFKEYLDLIESDLKDKDDVTAVTTNDVLELFNAYLSALINGNDANTSLDLFEYFQRMDVSLDLKPSIFRALIILCIEKQLNKKAEELYKVACKMGIYKRQSISASTLPHQMVMPTHLTPCEMKLVIRDYLQQLFPVLHNCKAEFERRFSLHIILKEFVPEDHAGIVILQDVSPQLQYAFERLKRTLMDESPSLDFEVLPDWVLSVKSNRLYTYFLQSKSGEFSPGIYKQEQNVNSRFELMDSCSTPNFKPTFPQPLTDVASPNIGFFQTNIKPVHPQNYEFRPPNPVNVLQASEQQMFNARPAVANNRSFHNINNLRPPSQINKISPNQMKTKGFSTEYQPRSSEFPPRQSEFSSRQIDYPPRPAEFPPRPAEYPPRPAEYPPRPPEFPPRPAEFPPGPADFPPRQAEFPPRPVDFPPRPVDFLLRPPDYPSRPTDYPSRPTEYPPRLNDFSPRKTDYLPNIGDQKTSSHYNSSQTSPKKKQKRKDFIGIKNLKKSYRLMMRPEKVTESDIDFEKESQNTQESNVNHPKTDTPIKNRFAFLNQRKALRKNRTPSTPLKSASTVLSKKFLLRQRITASPKVKLNSLQQPADQTKKKAASAGKKPAFSPKTFVNLTRTIVNDATATQSQETPESEEPLVQEGPVFSKIVNYITCQILRLRVPNIDATVHARRLAYEFWQDTIQNNPELLSAVGLDRNIMRKLVQYTKDRIGTDS